MLCFLGTSTWSQSAEDIRIYLAGEKTVSSEIFDLGQIAVVLGNEELVQSINSVPMGQFVAIGQKITIDRHTILSRLANIGIDSKSITFNGSEKVTINRDQKCITANEFLEAAHVFLQEQLIDREVRSIKVLRSPKDFALSRTSHEIALVPQMATKQNNSRGRIIVSAIQDGIELNRQEVVFAVEYTHRRLVAAQDLAAGTVLSKENTEVQEYGAAATPKEPFIGQYGLVTKRSIKSGSIISQNMLEPKSGPILIKPRQQVLVKLDTGALYISAPGIAMQEGRAGDIIQVQRGSRKTRDERIVVGKVMPDGTVKPML